MFVRRASRQRTIDPDAFMLTRGGEPVTAQVAKATDCNVDWEQPNLTRARSVSIRAMSVSLSTLPGQNAAAVTLTLEWPDLRATLLRTGAELLRWPLRSLRGYAQEDTRLNLWAGNVIGFLAKSLPPIYCLIPEESRCRGSRFALSVALLYSSPWV